jgi:hypothetical protein
VVTVFAAVDMVRNSERKNKAFSAMQERQREANLKLALQAYVRNEANEDQQLLIKQYKAIRDAEEARKKNQGFLVKSVELVFSNALERQHQARTLEKFEAEAIAEEDTRRKHQLAAQPGLVKVESTKQQGGLLDRTASNIASSASGWFSWSTGR